MSFDNPTALRIGARGALHGWSVTVVGRVVLGVELDGERYYWNEFNLVDAQGNSGTLVYEETEDGPEWKLFQAITPGRSLTAAEAARKRVGDTVDFGSGPLEITLVDRSRVYHIEGTPPEGVEIGDLADFLNADGGEHMYVASWTGAEIEFYEGRDLTEDAVSAAFGLSASGPTSGAVSSFRDAAQSFSRSSGSDSGSLVTKFVHGAVAVIALLAGNSFCSWRKGAGSSSPTVVQKLQPAPALRLPIGARGELGRDTYTVAAQALVEIGRTRGRFERREYQLSSREGRPAFLVQGLSGGTRQWHLFEAVDSPATFTPFVAAAQRQGTMVQFGQAGATITELFLSQVRTVEGGAAGAGLPAGRQYGFVAASGADWWVARWSESGLTLQRGRAVDEGAVLAALGSAPAATK
ncbi:MAG: hypothetical protein HZC55_01695 [Verrucomicrobia bacterium]|nr:hypothetical protein [Verrucomicrobiota bacterium]